MNITEFKQELIDNRDYFYQFPFPVITYYHWTAGRHFTTFDDYHYCIDGDGEIINTRPITETPSATWHWNTGSIAIALCACYNGTPEDLGEYAPTEAQIETLAQMTAVIAEVFDNPIDYDHFMTHGEAADEDGYGLYSGDPDCRWDLQILHNGDEYGTGGDIIREKAQYYLEQGV